MSRISPSGQRWRTRRSNVAAGAWRALATQPAAARAPTRDATATFSPDLCSRVTLVNFSVTAGGLEAQCVEALLEAERPDAHARRADVRKLQGEYRASLYSVEEKLLHELSSLKGNILDDDGVLSTLEHAQAEAAAIAAKAEGAEEAMAEVAAVAAETSDRLLHDSYCAF